MSLFITRNQQGHYVIKENFWVKGKDGPGATRQRYIGYVGKEPKLPLEKAIKICEKRGLRLEDLKRIRGLTIVEDGD